ncbi:MAG: DpnI domain-containing protein [Terracidiphilus sp.]
MLLSCDTSIADGYKSEAQKSRVLSEAWFLSNGYCLACDCDRLTATRANTKATDFVCPSCRQSYELKASRSRMGRTLVDGAYGPLMNRILEGSAPTLMMLERNDQWKIKNLTAIHHLFLTPNVLVERKPLSSTARRAGWVGCNIRLDQIAQDARIRVVGDGRQCEPRLVRSAFRQFDGLKEIPPSARGWTTLTLRMIRGLNLQEFSLSEVYALEHSFAAVYPENYNIRAKMRQQLQVLRDLGYFTAVQDRGNHLGRVLI